jgi:predicted nicotinamide N-methyase
MAAKAQRSELNAHGLKVLLARHPEIRRLKRNSMPSFYGNRPWSASWLLMEYFKNHGMRQGARVMEVGCGWGLAGIYCAKKHLARVTAVDRDREVFPFLRLHARINGVDISTATSTFERLKMEQMRGVDVLVGSDICFWDSMVEPLRRLIARALMGGVREVVVTDPGRLPFEDVGIYFERKGQGRIVDCITRRPRSIRGRILVINQGR